MKGPAGALFGRGSSGGLVNRVTKKPIFGSRFGDVSVMAASYDHVRLEGEYPDGASSDRVANRVTAAYENSNSDRPTTRSSAAPFRRRLSYRPGGGRELLVQADILFDDRHCPTAGSRHSGRAAERSTAATTAIRRTTSCGIASALSATWQQSLGQRWTLRNTFRDTYYTNAFSNTLPGAVTQVNDARYVARSR